MLSRQGSKLEQVYQQKRSDDLHGLSSHMKVIRLVQIYSQKDTKASSFKVKECPRAQDIVDGPKDGAKTEANAKALAEKDLRYMAQ